MAKVTSTRDSENIMPHNPLKSRELFAEVKDNIKGNMSWLEFDLRCIMAYLIATKTPNKVIEDALAQLAIKQALEIADASATPAAKPQAKKEAPATTATKKPGKAAPVPAAEAQANREAADAAASEASANSVANTGPKKTKDFRKTPEEVKAANATKAAKNAAAAAGAPGDDTPPTTEEVAELADVK